ncbi:MAG: beta-galactosidase [Deltaproteobacteria bacterium]|nr:beta-galactosidase [Deltaproteobacteria bacterium]
MRAQGEKHEAPAVRVGPSGLLLERPGQSTETLPFLAGSMHYFRLQPAAWGKCLDHFRQLELPIVDTYVPWAVHEREPGRYDFEGAPSEAGYQTDLRGFLEACAQWGLKVVLRPGPQVNAELTAFGLPTRVLAEPECLAVGGGGSPVWLGVPPRAFPVPSYASERYHALAGDWLAAFARFVAPYAWPDGPVVGVQVDNEATFFFRTAAYDQDYHPDALALHRRYLAERYGGALPAGYGAGATAASVEAPRKLDATRPEELVRHLDWVAFKEWMLLRALERWGGLLRAEGLAHLPLLHNFPATEFGEACSLAAAERAVDVAGLDLYLRRRDYATVRRHLAHLAGSSRLPVVSELGWGGWLWWWPQALEDQLHTALAALMHGAKGFNLYMLVERDRWYGAPVSPDGRPRSERYTTTRQLVSAVRQCALPELSRRVEVGLVRVREYRHLALCASLADPLPLMGLSLFGLSGDELCTEEDFGLGGPVQVEHERYVHAAEVALDHLRLPYHHVESDAGPEALLRYKLLVVPLFDFADAELLARLGDYVERGGALLVGPRWPSRDRTMQPLACLMPAHTLAAEEDLAEALEELAAQLELARDPVPDAEEVELVLYTDGERPRALFLANRSDASVTTRLRALEGAGLRMWDALTGEPVNPRLVHVEANAVRMLCCAPRELGEGAP